jgi:hypothetical protein
VDTGRCLHNGGALDLLIFADEPRSMPNRPQEIHHAGRRLDGLEQEAARALGDMDDGDPERQGSREHR